MANFTGTAGDDTFVGTADADTFDLTQGGSDTVSGGNGFDEFYLGAALDAGDRIDGEGGSNRLRLDGDYSGGLVLGSKTVTNISDWVLAAGHSYNFTVKDAANSGGVQISGAALVAGDSLIFNASAETSGSYFFYAGAGDDTLSGGGGNDAFNLYHGGNDTARGGGGSDEFTMNETLTSDDRLDGGDGWDTLYLNGDYSAGLVLHARTIQNIETIYLQGAFSYRLTLNDANVAANTVLVIDQTALSPSNAIKIDGSAETDGAFSMTGGAGNDRLVGGRGADYLAGDAGADTIVGGAGGDTIFGGLGHDSLTGGPGGDVFWFYESDSPLGNPDIITDLSNSDLIDLGSIDADTTTAGFQIFTLKSTFTGHAGQLVRSYDAGNDVTSFLMDRDGDSVADIIILAKGDHSTFHDFIL